MEQNTQVEEAEVSRNEGKKEFLINNFTYLKSVFGMLKISQLTLNIICFTLMCYKSTKYAYSYHFHMAGNYKVGKYYSNLIYKDFSENLFLVLVSFFLLFGTFLILISCIISFVTSCTLPRTVFYLIYHIIGFLLYFIGGLTVLIQESSFNRRLVIISAAAVGFINSFLYGYNVILAYKMEYGCRNIFIKT